MVARVLFPCSHVEERDQQSTSIPNKHISIPILVSEQGLLPAPGLSRRRFFELDAPIPQLLICRILSGLQTCPIRRRFLCIPFRIR